MPKLYSTITSFYFSCYTFLKFYCTATVLSVQSSTSWGRHCKLESLERRITEGSKRVQCELGVLFMPDDVTGCRLCGLGQRESPHVVTWMLVSCLSTLYELKVHRDSPRNNYLGYTIDYFPSSPSPCMTLSMPNYIPSMLSHLCPSGCGSASSPAIYTLPASHTDTPSPLPPSTTISLPVSPAEKTWIQRVAGSLLFYARALDFSIVCQLSSYQSNPTQLDLTAAHRLLN